MDTAAVELKGWKVEIDGDCDSMIVLASDPSEAERIGWEHYTEITGYTRSEIVANNPDGDATAVIRLPHLDGHPLTLRTLIALGLCAVASVTDATDTELDKAESAIYLTTEW